MGLTGLSDDDRALLDGGNLYFSADQDFGSWRDGIETFREAAESLCKTVESHLSGGESPPAEPEREILIEASNEYKTLLSDAKASLDDLITRAEAMTADPEAMDGGSPWRKWAEKSGMFKEEYDAAVQRSSAHREKMEQLKAIEDELREHARETGRVSEELRTLADAEETYQAARESWEHLLDKRDDALDEQCDKLTTDSGEAIRASVKRYADTTDFVDLLKQAVSGSRVPENRIEGLGTNISCADTPETASARWKGMLADLEKLSEFDEEKDGTDKRPDVPALSGAGLTGANLDGIGRILTADGWLTLSLTPIKSEPVFEYRAREQEYIPFRNASAGQQATALLKTLLNQQGPRR